MAKKGMNVQFTVGEVKDGLQKIEIMMDIPHVVPSSSTEANNGEIIDVTIAKHNGSTVGLKPVVRTIHGDLKSISSLAINVTDQETVNVKLKVDSDIITSTNPGSTHGVKNTSSTLPQSQLVTTELLIPVVLKIQTTLLLEDYFSDGLLDKASKCIEELRSPSYHPEIVKASILLGLRKELILVDTVFHLFEHLLKNNVLGSEDVMKGCLQCASMLEESEFATPAGLSEFSWFIRELVFAGVLDFKVVKWILVEFDKACNRRRVFFSFTWDYHVLKSSQHRDFAACEKLASVD